jgi:hypothetical protein
MKTTQAWGWLAAGVLAAGLNASYHDGGLEWAHRLADRIENNSAAVLALASGRADEFLTEARLLTAKDETASCPFATTMARIQARVQSRVETRIARSQAERGRFDAMSAREEAQLARLEANRARIEAQVEAQTARIRIPAAVFSPVLVRVSGSSVCPRVRVNVPRIPALKMPPLPEIHIATASAGPV